MFAREESDDKKYFIMSRFFNGKSPLIHCTPNKDDDNLHLRIITSFYLPNVKQNKNKNISYHFTRKKITDYIRKVIYFKGFCDDKFNFLMNAEERNKNINCY